MKYQHLASIALAALSAGTAVSAAPLKADESGSCPAGYSPSVYYITVTAEPSSTVEPTSSAPASTSTLALASMTPVNTATSTSTIDVISTSSSTAGLIETIPAAVVKAATSTTSQSATSTSALSISETAPTQVAVAQPSAATTAEKTSSTSTDTSSNSKSASSSTTTGEATFYGGNLSGGTCSFTDYTLPSHLSGVAFSGQAWDNAADCGACIAVTGPNGNTVKVMIVDKCPECATTHLDLFESAFTTLASASEGQIPVSYSFTPCGITSPLILRNKSGTSAYWFSMQVVNANGAVKSLEVSTDNGSTWKGTTRSDYNFFENSSGFGTDTVDVRVTGVDGGLVTVKNVSVASGKSVAAAGNF
ncbi:RlpA-like double-psi beta-barrel-protein domain-containing protein-containing protein [Aspergillus desertorum]